MKNLVVYLFLMGLFLYIVVMYERPDMLILVIAQVILLIIFLIFGIYIRRHIHLEIPQTIYSVDKNQCVSIRIRLINTGFLPVPFLRINYQYRYQCVEKSIKKKLWQSVWSKDTDEFIVEVKPEFSGELQLEITSYKAFEYFRMIGFRKKSSMKIKIHVRPDLYQTRVCVKEYLAYQDPDSEYYSSTKEGDDPSEIFKIRDYINGDKLQRIHWKLSAKRGHKLVKVFSQPIGTRIILLVDFYLKDQSQDIPRIMDAMIEVTAAISRGLLEAECIHRIGWYNKEEDKFYVLRITGMDDLFYMIERLSEAQMYSQPVDLADMEESLSRNKNANMQLRLDTALNFWVKNIVNHAFQADALKDQLETVQLDI